MTVETLKASNKKALAQLAKDRGIVGWHSMRKDQLIRALANADDAKKSSRPKPAAGRAPAAMVAPVPRPVPMPARALAEILPLRKLDHACQADRIVATARDSYWLHVHWELSRSTLARAQAALGQEWHAAKPILRLMDVTSEDTTSASEQHVRDIEIHGGVANWYIDVSRPPRSFRVDIGYLSKRGKFYVLAKSNVATTPKAGVSEVLDQGRQEPVRGARHSLANPAIGAADLAELSELQLNRPLNHLNRHGLGMGAFPPFQSKSFHFQIDAELIVFGSTEPNAQVTLQGEPVPVRPDGTFTVRFSLPENRQIIPAVASSPDGVEERTIVLAIERNTKELEPMIHDGNEL